MWTDSPAGLLLPNMPSSGLNDVVRARVDPVSGASVPSLPALAPVPNSDPVQSDWSMSTVGLSVGGDSSCALFDARTLPNGNILYCCGRDTTANSETTGVAEINPITREIVWQWRDPTWVADNGPEAAYKLTNGNYLICDVDGTAGANLATTDIIYELTPAKTKVWGYKDGARPNRIKPCYINGKFCIAIFGSAFGGADDRVQILDYDTRTIIWSMTNIGTLVTHAENAINGGDFRRIGGVNYLLVTCWLAAVPAVVLINYDTQTVISRTPTGTASGYGPLDVQWLSDTTCIIATGNGATGATDGTFKIARPFDAAVIATSASIGSRTMCCNVDPNTMQMTWCQSGPVIYSTSLSSLSWTQASATVTFTGSDPNVAYVGSDVFAVDDPVVFTNSGGSLPAAFTSGTTYYVKARNVAGNTMQMCATLPSASATVITPATSGGGGTHTATHNSVPTSGAAQRVLNRINSRGPILITGLSHKTGGTPGPNSGSFQIGADTTTCGYLDYSYADGVLYLDNSFNNSAGNIVLRTRTNGATTSQLSVPGLGPITQQLSTAVAAGTAISVGMKVSSTANLGIYWGTGAPSFSAGKGSLYLCTDASTPTTRAYINTDGAATWTNLTTTA